MKQITSLLKRGYLPAILLLVAVLLPFIVPSPYTLHIFIITIVFAILAASWNILNGFAGIKSLGHHAMFGLGAYTSAILSMRLSVDPWLGMVVGGLVAGLVGVLLAFPVLRLRTAPYIAIATLAFAEIVKLITSNLVDLTRGQLGLSGIPALTAIPVPWGEIQFTLAHRTNSYYLALIFLVFVIWLTRYISKSSIGLALLAIKESQDAAESLGVHLTKYKIIVFAISSSIAGVTGAFFAHFIHVLTPSSVMDMSVMIEILAITFIGGLGTIYGPLVGAVLIIAGLEYLRFLGDYRILIYGVLLVVTILWLPQGIVKKLSLKVRKQP